MAFIRPQPPPAKSNTGIQTQTGPVEIDSVSRTAAGFSVSFSESQQNISLCQKSYGLVLKDRYKPPCEEAGCFFEPINVK